MRGRGNSEFRGVFLLLKAALANAKWVTIGAMTLYSIARLESIVVAIGLKQIIDAMVAGSTSSAWMGIAQVVAGVSLLYIVDQVAWRLCLRLEDTVGHALARAAATIAILGTVHPLLLLLPLFGLPALVTQSIADRVSRRAEEETAPDLRRSRHLFELSVRADAAKELRIFGLRGWVLDTHRAVWTGVQAVLAGARQKSMALMAGGWLFFGAGFVAAVILITRALLTGDANLGDLVLTLTLGVRVGGDVGSIASEVIYVRRIGRLGAHLGWIESYAAKAKKAFSGARRLSDSKRDVVLENVSFRYPETSSLVLRDVSIRLRFGTTVAIVGQNGAGKTTLVKLLCRMYEPTEGRILIDGVPLSEIEPESWLSRITAAFQDFARLEVTARETIGVGDLGRMDDRAAIASAISRADAADVIDSLPAGVDTALGASWEGGYEPSIGQWQKLAIARCAMPEGPGASRRDRIT